MTHEVRQWRFERSKPKHEIEECKKWRCINCQVEKMDGISPGNVFFFLYRKQWKLNPKMKIKPKIIVTVTGDRFLLLEWTSCVFEGHSAWLNLQLQRRRLNGMTKQGCSKKINGIELGVPLFLEAAGMIALTLASLCSTHGWAAIKASEPIFPDRLKDGMVEF